MQVRFATESDIPALIEIGEVVHEVTRFKEIPYNRKRVEFQLKGLIADKKSTHCFFMAENKDGEAIGWLIGCVERHIFSEVPVASLINYGVVPDKRQGGAALKLISVFKKWAENRKAVEINVGVNSGVDLSRTDSFLKRLGFELTGGNYTLVSG